MKKEKIEIKKREPRYASDSETLKKNVEILTKELINQTNSFSSKEEFVSGFISAMLDSHNTLENKLIFFLLESLIKRFLNYNATDLRNKQAEDFILKIYEFLKKENLVSEKGNIFFSEI